MHQLIKIAVSVQFASVLSSGVSGALTVEKLGVMRSNWVLSLSSAPGLQDLPEALGIAVDEKSPGRKESPEKNIADVRRRT